MTSKKNRTVRTRTRTTKHEPVAAVSFQLRAADDLADWGKRRGRTEQQAEDAYDDACDRVLAAAIAQAANDHHPELAAALIALGHAQDAVVAAAWTVTTKSSRLAKALQGEMSAECDLEGFKYFRRVAERARLKVAVGCDLDGDEIARG